jgi:DNA polymerase I
MLVQTREIKESPGGAYEHAGAPLSHDQILWIYCGLDSALTVEVGKRITDSLSADARTVYAFERALRGPALEMGLRGVLVDSAAREDAIRKIKGILGNLCAIINRFAAAFWGQGLEPASPKQLSNFFYGAMQCAPIYANDRDSEEARLTTGKAALDKLHERYQELRPLIEAILLAKRFGKQLSVLQTQISNDSRMRTSFNPASTETGRWSSSRSFDGSGTNFQNIEEIIRRIFIADSGHKLAYIDKKSAESICVGYISGCENYLKACFDQVVDVHTFVANMVWGEMAWPGERAKWRDFAESYKPPEYDGKDLRDISKRLGHLSNYKGSADTAARIAKIAIDAAKDFQRRYFTAFKEISLWHYKEADALVRGEPIVTPFGRPRKFYGRPRDDSTLREAIANTPQSMTADDLNLGMYRVWRDAELHAQGLQLLLQVHDAILIQYPEEKEVSILPRVMDLLVQPVAVCDRVRGITRTMRIPVDCAVGWNFAKVDESAKRFQDGNPDGLIKWKGPGSDARLRQRRAEDSWIGLRYGGSE